MFVNIALTVLQSQISNRLLAETNGYRAGTKEKNVRVCVIRRRECSKSDCWTTISCSYGTARSELQSHQNKLLRLSAAAAAAIQMGAHTHNNNVYKTNVSDSAQPFPLLSL